MIEAEEEGVKEGVGWFYGIGRRRGEDLGDVFEAWDARQTMFSNSSITCGSSWKLREMWFVSCQQLSTIHSAGVFGVRDNIAPNSAFWSSTETLGNQASSLRTWIY